MSTAAPELGAGPTAAGAPAGGVLGRSPRQLFWERLRRDRAAMGGLVLVALLALIAILAGVISRNLSGHGPNDLFQFEMTDEFGLPRGPNGDFYFGADNVGRDLFVRVLYGTRTALLVGVVATGASVIVGTFLGLLAGYYGGWIDSIVSRVVDVMLSIPALLLALGLVAACGTTEGGCLGGLLEPGLPLVIVIVVLFGWPYIARIVRGQTISLREEQFVEASRSLGAGNLRIMLREILPNLLGPIVVYATLLIPATILFEAALSFLGLGVPQDTPSWGQMLAGASSIFTDAWWFMVFPGVFLLTTTLAFNLLGDGIRDALDPRTRV
ncbi:MAG: ABC transporter permease [Gaiellales bacterium]